MNQEREQDRAERKALLDAIVLMGGRLDRAIGGITGDPESALLPIPSDRDVPPPVVPVDAPSLGTYRVGDSPTASERAAAKAMAGAGQAPAAVGPPPDDDGMDEAELERELERRRLEEGRGQRSAGPNASWE